MEDILEIYKEHAYISEEGVVYLPIYDKDRNLLLTGFEYHQSLQTVDVRTVKERLEEAEQENEILKEQVQVLNATAEFHEELIAEMAMMLYA